MSGSDIVEFMIERENEREQVALAAAAEGGSSVMPVWTHEHERVLASPPVTPPPDKPGVRAWRPPTYWVADTDEARGRHIASQDPAWVLADVAAKRAIITRVNHAIATGIRNVTRYTDSSWHGDWDGDCYVACSCGWEHELIAAKDWDIPADRHLRDVGFDEQVRDDILRTLVQPYADHPDFDPAWRVESEAQG